MKTLQRFSLLVCAAALLLGTLGTSRADSSDNIYNYLQLMRSDFNSVKVEVVNKIMKLSEADAKKFWPLYREYENELGKLAVSRTELIAGFVKAHNDGTFDDAKTRVMADARFKGQRARLDLLEEYHGKIEKPLSPVQAGQFLQIENQIGLFIDVTTRLKCRWSACRRSNMRNRCLREGLVELSPTGDLNLT